MAKRWHYHVNSTPIVSMRNTDVLVERIKIACNRHGLTAEDAQELSDMTDEILKHNRTLPRARLKALHDKVGKILSAHTH